MKASGRYLLFDFDGVIADSFEASFSSLRVLCTRVTQEEYVRFFEGNVNHWPELVNCNGDGCSHDGDFFIAHEEYMKTGVYMISGMGEVVARLAQKHQLFIISSTTTSIIRTFLERNGLTSYFSEILGNDVHASKVEKMRLIFRKWNLQPAEGLFITDTLGDIREAHEARVKAIAVTWGFHERERLERGRPLAIVETPDELEAAVAGSWTMPYLFNPLPMSSHTIADRVLTVVASLAFIAFSAFLTCILFIKPAFLSPVTEWIENFGRFTIGGFTFSLGGTLAIILFFGLMRTAYDRIIFKKQAN